MNSSLKKRREKRNRIAESLSSTVWDRSPKEPNYDTSDSEGRVKLSDKIRVGVGSGSISSTTDVASSDLEPRSSKKSKKQKKKAKHLKKEKKKHKRSSQHSALECERLESESRAVSEIMFERKREEKRENSPVFGPQLPGGVDNSNAPSRMDYGSALLPGEGEAMAQFVADGKRIPRRGEIGLTSNEIESFEDVGFVMSGSRHRRMEAVRLRKENQIYNADDRRALAMFNYEERSKRETKLLTDFKEMVQKKLQANQHK